MMHAPPPPVHIQESLPIVNDLTPITGLYQVQSGRAHEP